MYDDKYPVYGVSTSGYFSNPWRTEPEEEKVTHFNACPIVRIRSTLGTVSERASYYFTIIKSQNHHI